MKRSRKANKAGKTVPRKSETRITAPTVPGLKINQKHKHRNHTDKAPKAKVGADRSAPTKASRRTRVAKAIDSRTEVINKAKGQKIGIGVHVTSPEKIKALAAIRDAMPSNTAITQEQRLLAALAKFSLSTYEASRYLDVYDPRARIMGLRNKGHNIVTSKAMVHTECGRLHLVGIYTLHRGGLAAVTTHRQPSLFPDGALADAGHA